MKVIIVGGGPAGLAAAVALKEKGVDDLLILEREPRLGGILNQCIHDGFGLTRFGKNISGPEYAQAFIDRVQELGIETITDCTVINISPEKLVTAVCYGRFLQLQADAPYPSAQRQSGGYPYMDQRTSCFPCVFP